MIQLMSRSRKFTGDQGTDGDLTTLSAQRSFRYSDNMLEEAAALPREKVGEHLPQLSRRNV
jgi:hypothetical protein